MNLAALKGEWAVVTGASAGIGQAFARRLAQRGMHVALVARRADALSALASELESSCGVRTAAVALDLTEAGATIRLLAALDRLGIVPRLLVNNAAVGRWGPFEQTDADVHRQLVLLNAVAPMELCQAFLPILASRGSGAVINVSSPAAVQPVPYMAAYAASKAFLHSLSLALHEEWRERNVYVQTLVPGPTASEFDRKAGAYESALGAKRAAPDKAVAASLQAFASGMPLVASASGLFAQQAFAALAPSRFVLRKVGQMFRPPGRQG